MDVNSHSKSPNENQTSNKFCSNCGAKLPRTAIICPNCGISVIECDDSFSPDYQDDTPPDFVINHMNTAAQSPVGQKKNKWIAFILCLYLGMLGVHKFYEGHTKTGILYLCTMGLFGFGWIFDCISILFKPNPYYV